VVLKALLSAFLVLFGIYGTYVLVQLSFWYGTIMDARPQAALALVNALVSVGAWWTIVYCLRAIWRRR
jgi:hypothetical protein